MTYICGTITIKCTMHFYSIIIIKQIVDYKSIYNYF